MKRHASIITGLVFSFSMGLAQAGEAVSLTPSKAPVLRIVPLEGTPYERGLEHGRVLRKEIQILLERWRADVKTTFAMDASKFVPAFLKATNYLPAIEKWTPGLLDEVRGIAEGAGVDFETMLVYQLPDELWSSGHLATGHNCSSIAIKPAGDQPAMIGQNMDIPDFYHGCPTVLHIQETDTDPEAFVYAFPGIVALNGMNRHAVAINCNTLLQLKPSQDGLPVAFVVRGVLRQKSFQDAVRFVESIRHASGQNYMLGGIDDAGSFECSANQVVRFREPAARAWHTDHPLANDDFTSDFVAAIEKQGRNAFEGTRHCNRLASLVKRLEHVESPVGLELIQATLRSRDVPYDSVNNAWTYGCTIMVLSEEPQLYLAPGRPHETKFELLQFAKGHPSKVKK